MKKLKIITNMIAFKIKISYKNVKKLLVNLNNGWSQKKENKKIIKL